MIPSSPLHGLVVAAHTPFHADGSLHLAVIEKQAAHFLATGANTVFVCGTTGESSSLTLDERRAIAEAWFSAARGSNLRIVVHVGSSSLAEASLLASHAQKRGASAIAALSPSYFKPRSLDLLIDCCAQVASAAQETPFYFYDIPALTGVSFSMGEFLTRAPQRIPTLAGLKFTNPDLKSYLHCLRLDGGRWDVPFGVDEHLLGALAMGARGAVGSGFNFAAPIYLRLIKAFHAGDWEKARLEQHRGGQLVEILSGYGYMAAAKALMEMIGVPVGPPRLPHNRLTAADQQALRQQLESLGAFGWIA